MGRFAGPAGAGSGQPCPPVQKKEPRVVALAGNPNVGKSTVFNALTNLHQHTGNWPGKTVEVAQGRYVYRGEPYMLVDLPGTYSLLCASREEEVAADFILHGAPDCVLAVCDATCLERNLVLVLQILELTAQVVVCVNLLDEARKRGIQVDLRALERALGVPVVGAAAGRGEGLETVMAQVRNMADGFAPAQPQRLVCDGHATGAQRLEQLRGGTPEESDAIALRLVRRAEEITAQAVRTEQTCPAQQRMQHVDRIVMGRGGIPIMLALLVLVFWLTIEGANYPSAWLQAAFDALGQQLWRLARWLQVPEYISAPLLDGMYATAARVVAVMLPPMAIFFPLFTLLEDLGYLPRVAFLLDNTFRRCGACGKQALTLCMGFGCNAAGVVGCRIIDSPRERRIAVLTNALVPCNGRFPTMITLIAIFFSGSRLGGLTGAVLLTGLVLLGVLGTFAASKLLSRTILKGMPSSFAMELPPYRRPQLGRVLVRSVLDRTLHVLGRAAAVAAPAGLVIWLLANVAPGGVPLIQTFAEALDPVGRLLGMNGVILAAFILGFPANELVLPVVVLILASGGVLTDVGDTAALGELLRAGGWTWVTALCTMVFSLFHWPCSTTCLTIRRETGSWRWVLLAIALPTALGTALCILLRLLLA